MYSIASWSPSQSEPLTVSYMWKRQLSPSPILPSEAAMPPCAATVWLRVGKTFVTQAGRTPAAASADDNDVKAVFDDFVGFRHRLFPTMRREAGPLLQEQKPNRCPGSGALFSQSCM